jgi:hypothetical protein
MVDNRGPHLYQFPDTYPVFSIPRHFPDSGSDISWTRQLPCTALATPQDSDVLRERSTLQLSTHDSTASRVVAYLELLLTPSELAQSEAEPHGLKYLQHTLEKNIRQGRIPSAIVLYRSFHVHVFSLRPPRPSVARCQQREPSSRKALLLSGSPP